MSDKTAKLRQQKRRAALNEAARSFGFTSWARFETAVINGEYIPMEADHDKQGQSQDRKER
jgi:hypothetical protein